MVFYYTLSYHINKNERCYTYNAYGKLTNRTGTTDTPFMYNGRDGVVTDENGLYYMRARYYNPVIKRFINADIVSGDISNAVTLNRFAYANGNPVSFVDPFGLSPERGTITNSDDYVTMDIDTDGITDCYVYQYSYSYSTGWWFWKKNKTVEGKVYIYVNKNADFFNDANNIPPGFNHKTDLMIGDFTSSSDPNMYAHQAHKLNAKSRKSVINIMQRYDKDFNTPWERNDGSLLVEWEEHHKYSVFSTSAQNVDFNNEEEGMDEDYFEKKAKERAVATHGGFAGVFADIFNFIS